MAKVLYREEGTREDHLMKRVFLSPAVIMLLLLSIFPLLWSLTISFTDIQRGRSAGTQNSELVDAGGSRGFLGLGFNMSVRNYARMGSDQRLHIAARNMLFYVVVGVIVQYAVGFGLALVLNQRLFGRNIIRAIFMLPMMMTPVAAAYTGRMMFDSSLSPIAHLLRTMSTLLGLKEPIIIPWLTSATWAPFTIVLIDSWQWIPFMMVLLLVGMQAIPDELYEAARVDGAGPFMILRKITIPILLPISMTAILIRGLEIFKIIDVIVVTTGGGPGSSTESLTMYIFKTALTFGNYSYAAAISYVLLVLVILFTMIFLFFAQRLIRQTR
ncbi:MAG: ABC transporter permease subunit [Spirochaeta sp.]|nr:ABC transporter permease subunit [Spirochaeta sp.]